MNKKLICTFTLIVMLSGILSPNINPSHSKVSAQGTKFPKLGSEKLADAEGYEEVGMFKKIGLSLTDSPTKEANLDKIYEGFYISGRTDEDLEEVVFRVTRGDDSVSGYIKLYKPDTFFGDEEFDHEKSTISELYTFTTGVKKIEFYYSGAKNFDVIPQEFPISEKKEKIKTGGFASTGSETKYKDALFTKLGFNIVTREEWGGPTGSTWEPSYYKINRIVVHHTATSVDMSNPKNTVKAIYNFHYYRCADNSGSYNAANPQPNCDELHEWWQDIGYNYLIDPYGNVYEGRAGGNASRGAHAIPNSGSIGIGMIGNYVSQEPTQASMDTLAILIARLTEINDFDAVWHGGDPKSDTGLYAHRDLEATACPGNRIYNKLASIAKLAIDLKWSNETVQDAVTNTRDLTKGRKYKITNGYTQVLVDTENMDPLIKEKLLTSSRRLQDIKQKDDMIIYSVPTDLMSQLITEISLIAPNSNPQPNFLYKISSWDNTDPQRSIPSDYNTTTHWTHEKTKAPEAWKSLGGCTSNDNCGGSSSVTVAVIDTGVAYENYPDGGYDAGDDDSYTTTNFSGLYIEYPTDPTKDGTFVNGSYKGYERQYQVSSELNNVTFVSPYDAVQDFFCFLRTLDGSSANNCNENELEKRFHANDDHGHGTFVTSIIAADTGDAAANKIVGIAHNVQIMPIKVFYPNDTSMCMNSSGGQDLTCANPNYDYRVAGDSIVISAGIDYAVANGADVINLSLTGSGTDPVMEESINDAVAAGVVVVAAAGNDGGNINNYFPASFKNVIAVGASTSTDTRASYSNFGSSLDLVAPVGDSGPKIASQAYTCYPSVANCSNESSSTLFTTFSSSTTPITGTGTSFAAPQVSAAAALMKSIDPDISPSEVNLILKSTATDVGTFGRDDSTGHGILNIDEAISNIWSDWNNQPGATAGDINMAVFNGNLYQAIRGTDNWIYTRSSADGVNWGSYSYQPGASASDIKMIVFNSKLYQAIRGLDNAIYTRSSANGVTWSSWSYQPGATASNVNMAIFNGNLYQAIRGTDNRIYTRYSTDGNTWQPWTTEPGAAAGDINMFVFNSKLYQAIRGLDNAIYTRSSANGVSWSSWSHQPGATASDVVMIEFDGKLYQAIRGTDNRIYTRYSTNGNIWQPWTTEPGAAASNINMAVFDGKLYQAIRGTDNSYYTRYSNNGTTWSYWIDNNRGLKNVVMITFTPGATEQLFQAVRSLSSQIYTRHLD